jgi:hypothetical protein
VKELLQAFLADYLRIVEPGVAGHLDLGSLRFPGVTGRVPPDLAGLLVAEARSSQGEELMILLLVEPEPLSDPGFARRLSQVFAAVEIRLGRPVLVSFLFLRGGKAGINLATAPVCKLIGLDNVRLYFSTFGLEGSAAEYYLDRPEPLAWGLAAWMQGRCLGPSQLRHACRERIRSGGLDATRRRLLLRCVGAAATAAPPAARPRPPRPGAR